MINNNNNNNDNNKNNDNIKSDRIIYITSLTQYG